MRCKTFLFFPNVFVDRKESLCIDMLSRSEPVLIRFKPEVILLVLLFLAGHAMQVKFFQSGWGYEWTWLWFGLFLRSYFPAIVSLLKRLKRVKAWVFTGNGKILINFIISFVF
jgi:hypothetical protein